MRSQHVSNNCVHQLRPQSPVSTGEGDRLGRTEGAVGFCLKPLPTPNRYPMQMPSAIQWDIKKACAERISPSGYLEPFWLGDFWPKPVIASIEGQ